MRTTECHFAVKLNSLYSIFQLNFTLNTSFDTSEPCAECARRYDMGVKFFVFISLSPSRS